MNEQRVITDFEGEILSVCKKYERDIPHAGLVGVLTVVAHIYMDAQINNVDFAEIKENSTSPLPAETKEK